MAGYHRRRGLIVLGLVLSFYVFGLLATYAGTSRSFDVDQWIVAGLTGLMIAFVTLLDLAQM